MLLLDEPASGLDPRARIEIRGLLKELRNMGKTIMVSSHILPELADICNKIGIIEKGDTGTTMPTVDDVLRQGPRQLVLAIEISGDRDAAARSSKRTTSSNRSKLNDKGIRVTRSPKDDHDYSVLSKLIMENGSTSG